MRTRKRRKTAEGPAIGAPEVKGGRGQVTRNDDDDGNGDDIKERHSICQKQNHPTARTKTTMLISNKCTILNKNIPTSANPPSKLTTQLATIINSSKQQQQQPFTCLPAIFKNHLLFYLSTTLLILFFYYLNYNPHNVTLVNCQARSIRYQQTPPFIPQQQLQQQQSLRTNLPELIAQQGGLIKDKNVTLTKQYNPILVTKDIIIRKGAKLTIESGTELLFDKRRGIVVYGTLEILGNSNDRVKLSLLKSQQSATVNFRSQNNQPIGQQQIRLVDGDLPNEGRVQIKFNDRWHSLCTNSKNLTTADIRVLCQQVGYQDGHWYKWFPRKNETTIPQIMSKSFHCSGQETAITQCKRWQHVRTGGGVCDYHSDIGIRCSKTMAFSSTNGGTTTNYDYWRGIEFQMSETSHEYLLDSQMKRKVSKSTVRHLSISDAGLNEVGNATAAIRVYGQPPQMSDIEIKNSIYGIMIEDVDDAVRLDNIRLVNNMASPLFINTSWGRVSMDNMIIENNGGDGIRIARHEKILVGSHDFCKFANLGSSQSFPVVLSHEQTFFTAGRDCCQEFVSNDHQLTVHFPVLRSTPNNLLPEGDANRRITIPAGVNIGKDAHLIIYDDYRDEFPFRLRIQNGTRAQSVVSRSGRLKICYEPANYRTVLFTLEVVSSHDDEEELENWTGMARDVDISNSYIKSNEGRGIWVENPRSGLKITNTTVLNHNYLSGVHVENGTGEVIIQGSTIAHNIGHGVFINLAGGYYHIDNSTISDNSLKGVSIEYDKRSELVPFNHTVHVGYSLLARNGENGIFLGNVCRSDAFWNISMNSFIKNGEDAIYFQSCSPTQQAIIDFKNLSLRLNMSDPELQFHNNYQELFVTHNVFLANLRRAIHMAPIFFVKSFIRHNLFREHQLAVLYISNQAVPDFETDNNQTLAPVNIRIASNRFYSNRGRYVANIGLQEDNPRHSLIFTKNTLEDNSISEPYTDLKPRSRVSAVVVVSSSNTKVIRNRFDNPLSTYEMGSHLEMHSKIINATTNFWGPGLDAISIYKRIFDRKNRYNLAQIEFLQYLLSPEDLEYASDLSFDRERDKISTFKNGSRLGGEVKGYEELNPGTYTVENDIYIRKGGHLILRPGTVFKFSDGVGMMVQGRLDALGQQSSQIVFTSNVATDRRLQRIPVTTTTTTSPSPMANPWVSHQLEGGGNSEDDDILVVNGTNQNRKPPSTATTMNNFRRTTIKKRDIGPTFSTMSSNVRLSHTTMGRLEVQIDGVWGPVCDYNFDINDAAVVCQQLGMILNKDDWLLEKFQYAANDRQQISMMSTNVLMTNLRCDPSLDTDITRCKAEVSMRGDFDGMCNSEVGIRCFPPSWSGVRLGMGADTSTLEHVTIQRAGMYDYAAYTLKPALQVDFNRHWLTSLIVKFNSDSGLGIMWNDVIGRHFSELSITDSKFHNNERHGIELRSKGLSVRGCSISSNRQNGLDYNPTFSQAELNDLLSWLNVAKNSDHIVTLNFPLQSHHLTVPSSEDSYKFIIFQKNPPTDLKETFTIGTDPGHMLSIHQLIPIHLDSTESINMTLGNNANQESIQWDLKLNTTSFPMISPGYKFHFNYSTGARPRGNIVLYIRSRYNNRDLKLLTKYVPAHLVMHKFEQTAANINSKLINSLVISGSNITKNRIGLNFRHPNFPYDHEQVTYSLRYANETTNITNNVFDGNYYSSIFVSPGDLESVSNLIQAANNRIEFPTSEINYNLLGNKIRRNKDGIRQFGRDIRYSNNVFHWTINDTIFDYNKGGGIHLVLPYFWRYDANLSHSFEFHNNTFIKNSNFEFNLDGHFVVLNFTRNTFRENKCNKIGLINLNGMEKRMIIKYNTMEHNVCTRIVDSNIQSHADKMGLVSAHFEYNSLLHNRKQQTAAYDNNTLLGGGGTFKNLKLLAKLHPQATEYTMCLKGVQSMNITRNLFVNPELRFELVVGIIMDPNERTVNAIENYWGSVLQAEIDDRIFDFDDWNNYAVAEVSPYLTQESFYAATMIGEGGGGGGGNDPSRRLYNHQQVVATTAKPLGGRLTKSLTLQARREPYIIESDLTVMPNVRLTIERGTTLEFMPNSGILVLGNLIAAGTRDRPIQMKPYLSASDILPLQQYLYPHAPKTKQPYIVQNYLTTNDPMDYNYPPLRHHQSAYPYDMGSIRLCKNEICNDGSHIYENNVEDQILRQEVLRSSNNTWKMDGFLEIFNMTTLQWAPVCDPLFTEHSARVVCRQFGYTHFSLFKRGRRHTLEQEQIVSIRNWPDSVQCDGDESTLSSCPLATGFINHTTSCSRESNQFVYIYCQDFSDAAVPSAAHNHGVSDDQMHHWGGIRFSCPSMVSQVAGGSDDNHNNNNINLDGSQHDKYAAGARDGPGQFRSRLQHVSIDRAGMFHRKKSPSVQVLHCNVQLEHVSVTNSAHHGLEIITSQGNQNFHQLKLRNNLGIGFNYLSLTGSSSASRLVPYLPLKHLDISSDIFGLVDICGANKEIQIEERLLLFYRYSSQAVDCVKIVSSKLNIKHIGVRMLQFDLFNSTPYTMRPDSVRVYDGSIFDRDSRLIVEMGVTERHRLEKPELKFYQTTDSSVTIRLHASGASPFYGFIAEVVTTPVTYNIQRDTYNNITFSEISNNKLGALTITSAGESSPNLIIRNNRFESNCMHLFGNFTSCNNPIYMELQNCQRLRIINNLVKQNQGGIMIKSYSHSAVSALEASIENNVFENNENTNILMLLGPKQDPYQTVRVTQNIFTRNNARYLSNIVLSRIVANFSHNIISGNMGKHQIEVIGFDKLPLSYQHFSSNWIYNNTATYERDRSTIFGNSAGQQYYRNYLVNPDNHFEISTMNWSRYDVKVFHVPKDDEIIHLAAGDGSTRDVFRKVADAIPVNIIDTKRNELYQATINAKHNWWGFNSTSAIQGRIRDRLQHEELLKVDFVPYLETNRTVLSDICTGGWQKVGDACLVYIGVRMTYQEARDFCDRERATLPLLRGNHYDFSDFVKSNDRDFEPRIDRVWVRSFDFSREACPALNDFRTKNYDCHDRNSFICEKDPQIVVSLLHWHRETGGLIALILALITAILTMCCTVCWGYKSRQRHKEQIERKNTIYASMRSNRSHHPYSSSNSLSELFLHRQIYNPEKSSITDLSLSTQLTQPASDLTTKLVRLDPKEETDGVRHERTKKKKHKAKKQQPRGGSSRNGASGTTTTNTIANDPTYVNSPPRPKLLYHQPQPSMNPAYIGTYQAAPSHPPPPPPPPPPSKQLEQQQQHHHQEPMQRPASGLSSQRRSSSRDGGSGSVGGSPRAPSFAGSHTSEILTNPMPFTYSQINHAIGANIRSNGGSRGDLYYTNQYSPQYEFHNGSKLMSDPSATNGSAQVNLAPAVTTATHKPISPPSYHYGGGGQQQQVRDIDESESSVPTYYSNVLDNFDESTQSYIEAYDDAYTRTLQSINNDQSYFLQTEKSSTTTTTTTDLMLSSTQQLSQPTNYQLQHHQQQNHHPNRYFVETSFDLEDSTKMVPHPPPPPAPTSSSIFGGSQRLSPVSSSLAPPDSKLGSRVYLETSFE